MSPPIHRGPAGLRHASAGRPQVCLSAQLIPLCPDTRTTPCRWGAARLDARYCTVSTTFPWQVARIGARFDIGMRLPEVFLARAAQLVPLCLGPRGRRCLAWTDPAPRLPGQEPCRSPPTCRPGPPHSQYHFVHGWVPTRRSRHSHPNGAYRRLRTPIALPLLPPAVACAADELAIQGGYLCASGCPSRAPEPKVGPSVQETPRAWAVLLGDPSLGNEKTAWPAAMLVLWKLAAQLVPPCLLAPDGRRQPSPPMP